MSTQTNLTGINFFIASTFEDLRFYREEVIRSIKNKAGVINAQEFFGARSQKSIKTCLEEVGKSRVFILVLGMRYGSKNRRGKSFTELEYLEAERLDLLRLAYVFDESHPLPPRFVDTGEDAEKLRRFKDLVKSDLTVDTFTTPEDLSNKVTQDLVRELPRKGFLINTRVANEQDEMDLPILIRKFKTLPKIFYGREFEITARVREFKRASERECEAFSFTYGAALKREIECLDKEIDNLLGYELKAVYAEYDLAQRLFDQNLNSELRLKAKTIQGISKHKIPIYQQQYNPNSLTIFTQTDMVIVDHEIKEDLLIGLKLLEIID